MGGNLNKTNRTTSLLDATGDVGLKINTERIQFIFDSDQQDAGPNSSVFIYNNAVKLAFLL
jgi:hypothetical protein